MDPNATLAEIRGLVSDFTSDDPWNDSLDAMEAGQALAEAVDALDQFLTRGGFFPDAWSASDHRDDLPS